MKDRQWKFLGSEFEEKADTWAKMLLSKLMFFGTRAKVNTIPRLDMSKSFFKNMTQPISYKCVFIFLRLTLTPGYGICGPKFKEKNQQFGPKKGFLPLCFKCFIVLRSSMLYTVSVKSQTWLFELNIYQKNALFYLFKLMFQDSCYWKSSFLFLAYSSY